MRHVDVFELDRLRKWIIGRPPLRHHHEDRSKFHRQHSMKLERFVERHPGKFEDQHGVDLGLPLPDRNEDLTPRFLADFAALILLEQWFGIDVLCKGR